PQTDAEAENSGSLTGRPAEEEDLSKLQSLSTVSLLDSHALAEATEFYEPDLSLT
ncbi:unnamed protein product, partial [Amoebophrya sp. A25]